MNITTQLIENGFDRVTPTYYETPISNFSNLIESFYLKNVSVTNISRITMFIRDIPIQSFTGEYIQIYRNLRTPLQKRPLFNSKYIAVPFKKYLPVYEDCKIVLELFQPADASLFIEYVFTDVEPKPAVMLIEQVQTIGFTQKSYTETATINLNFNHPVKEMYIKVSDPDSVSRIRLNINEFTKIDENAIYFRYVQPLDYHTSVPGDVFTYSFCLDPESDLPTGSINMGRIKNQTIKLTWTKNNPVSVYAVNYNVLTPEGILVFR